MNLIELKDKLEKGRNLGAEVVYIKEENLLCGIGSIYKDQEEKSITILKSEEETIKVNDFIKLLNEICVNIGNGQVYAGSSEYCRKGLKEIVSLEFAQYEATKMIFINI